MLIIARILSSLCELPMAKLWGDLCRALCCRCGRDRVRCCSSLRWLIMAIAAPCCGRLRPAPVARRAAPGGGIGASAVTGTIFGSRKGRVNLCIQERPGSPPLVVLEFSTPTQVLAKEMQADQLRIVLECEMDEGSRGDHRHRKDLFSERVWMMVCNGRKVGFAIKKQSFCTDRSAIGLMQSESMGAGVIPVQEGRTDEEDLIYMRAQYRRVVGSVDSQAFHMISPDPSSNQELSIFFLRH